MKNKINFSTIFFFLFCLFILASSWLLYQQGWRWFVVSSGSMQPALAPGSLIVSRPQPSYQPGDVITYKKISQHHPRLNPDSLVTHRVVKTKKTSQATLILTQGDANQDPDIGWINQEAVMGKAIFCLPLIGYGLLFAQSKWGVGIFVLLPACLLITLQFKKIIKSLGQEQAHETS